jgi:thioredoxin-dependent peroxiredoxin
MPAYPSGARRLVRFASCPLNPSLRLILAFVWMFSIGVPMFAQTPVVGDKAPDFTLPTPSGKAVRMSSEQQGQGLILVVLRGYPGYQCPYCVRQVHDFVKHAPDFAAKNTRVLLVYPGPPANLDQHAKEFLEKQADLPANIVLVTDPDYKVTNLYGLRWNAPNETAYPSTFILDNKGMVVFEKISRSHGDRLSAQDTLDRLAAQ